MQALGHGKLLDSPHEIIQKPIRIEKLREVVRKYVPQVSQQQQTSFTAEKKESIDIIGAWRLLQNIKHAINEDSLAVGLSKAHHFGERAKDDRLEPDNKSRDTLSMLLSRSHGGKLFAGLVQLLHGGIGCLELLPIA
jgi:hypothetical protein